VKECDVIDAAWEGVPTGSLWIIGLSSSGKSTLARRVIDRLRKAHVPTMLLDGDQVRLAFEDRLGYDPASRHQQTMRVLRLARMVSAQGILPVVAIIHPFEADRVHCRQTLPGYFEVHLDCTLSECERRDRVEGKNVYRPGAPNVVGHDIPYERPERADLVLPAGTTEPVELEHRLFAELARHPAWQAVARKVLPQLAVAAERVA
jgi:adenylylsulfate kinase-like enzyme